MPLSTDDCHYVSRAQNGDCEAFNVLVRKYQAKVRRLIARFVTDSTEVEDLTQESFIRAYRAITQFRGESAFYTWLYKIAQNTAKHHVMDQKYKRQQAALPLDEAQNDENPTYWADNQSPEAILMSKQIAKTVDKALHQLSDDLRQALELREFEGLSYEAIAQIMNCPIGTVRSRIFRAREMIAQYLKPLIETNKRRW